MGSLLLAVIYLSFISLGLPDGLLGSGWPVMYPEFGVPVSWAGFVSVIISCGTVTSALNSDRLNRRLGAFWVTVISVAMTAVALGGFGLSSEFWQLCLWAIPYGLGAGSVDAALNNFVALHYASRHMSWLHCAWAIGATTGPVVMGSVLTQGMHWSRGYFAIMIVQAALTLVILLSMPLWKVSAGDGVAGDGAAEAGRGEAGTLGSEAGVAGGEERAAGGGRDARQALSLRQVLRIPGAPSVMVAFFCYCGIEQTAGLWGASFLNLERGMSAQAAAGFSAVFFAGMMIGRGASGFLTMRFSDLQMSRLGQSLILAGLLIVALPLPAAWSAVGAQVGLILAGLGCAPIFPAIIHATPARFGAERSQAIIGVQMAAAYVGSMGAPVVFGGIAQHLSTAWLPAYLGLMLVAMVYFNERAARLTGA